MSLIYGVLWAFLGQLFSFMQMQGGIKYGWYDKYPIMLILSSIPSTWFYMKSVQHLVDAFNGELWPSRLIGFGIGIIVFVTLSMLLFKEPITLKTLICLLLACIILGIQIFWK
jgi:multidrug transporter EmrE-like cation transporter